MNRIVLLVALAAVLTLTVSAWADGPSASQPDNRAVAVGHFDFRPLLDGSQVL